MKKLLSILGAIGLTSTSTTSLIACNKPDNSENGGGKPENWNPQKPPENSNWKLESRSILPDNKWYIAIVKKKRTDNFYIIKFKFSNKSVWSVGAPYDTINGIWYIVNSFYQWQGDNDPNIPEIDISTGKIKDWKE